MTELLDAPTSELRQGDVCGSWVFPRWQFNSLEVTGPPGGPLSSARVNVWEKGADLHVLVCSRDCEAENPRDRAGVLVAPLLPWPFLASDPRSAVLATSSAPAVVPDTDPPESAYSFINLYPLLIDLGEGEQWSVADLSAITAMCPAKKAVPALLGGKRAEMTDAERFRFQDKLAAFFIHA